MIDITVDGYGAEGKVVKAKGEDEYDVIIKVPFVFKETAEATLSEFAKCGLKLEEIDERPT